MRYVDSAVFRQFKRAAERAELQWQALAEDIQRERLRKHTAPRKKKGPAAAGPQNKAQGARHA